MEIKQLIINEIKSISSVQLELDDSIREHRAKVKEKTTEKTTDEKAQPDELHSSFELQAWDYPSQRSPASFPL